MPLLDHFHPPLRDLPPWESIATMWAASLVRWLNDTLPRSEYIAYPKVHLGSRVEADVAEYEVDGGSVPAARNGAVATLPAAPPALLTIPAVFPDDIEVRVGTSRHEMNLCAVVEFVSEGNKKEGEERRAFVTKCVSYLRRGIGVVIVDVVTSRRANFHNELLGMIGGPTPPAPMPDAWTYVAAYRPVHRRESGANEIEIWPYPAPVGQPIPSAPLALRRGPTVVLPLEATYTEAIRDLGL
jgi:hypothetical protein